MEIKSSMMRTAFLAAFALLLASPLLAQCEKWQDSERQEEAEEAHVLYRQYLKNNDYAQAYDYWATAYEIAPAADGQRPFHFMDGRTLYLDKFKNETDEAKKKEYAEAVLRLYDEEIACYGNEAYLLGRKGYDMFYNLRTPYTKVLETLQSSLDKGGNETEYIVLDPMAHVVVWLFEKERMDAGQARAINLKLNEIADHNIASNKEFGTYYQQAKDAMNGTFRPIELKIFDCDYFKKKYEPVFRENPDDYETTQKMYNTLVQQGCDEADPLVAELKAAYETVVAEINATKLKEFYASNPGAHAKALYDEGKYNESIARYKEAITEESAGEGDKEKLAQYNFAIASILFRKQKSYSSAREYARKAASLKPGWGQPYMAIGDMYASTSNSCGKDAWDKQIAILAAIDKYAYAKSIDPEVAEEANKKIGKYSGFKPEKQDGFMRGVKAGQTVKVSCWIGETVKVRFK